MLEHTDDGALGIVLNRPSETPLDDVFPEWRAIASSPATVFSGGPVSPDAVIALARSERATTEEEPTDGWVEIAGDLGTVDLARDPLDLGIPLDALRVFVGYAGLGRGPAGIRARARWVVRRRRRTGRPIRRRTRTNVAARPAPPAHTRRDVRAVPRRRDDELARRYARCLASRTMSDRARRVRMRCPWSHADLRNPKRAVPRRRRPCHRRRRRRSRVRAPHRRGHRPRTRHQASRHRDRRLGDDRRRARTPPRHSGDHDRRRGEPLRTPGPGTPLHVRAVRARSGGQS